MEIGTEIRYVHHIGMWNITMDVCRNNQKNFLHSATKIEIFYEYNIQKNIQILNVLRNNSEEMETPTRKKNELL